jgi:hypothetical protein
MTTPHLDAKSGVVLVERIEKRSRELSHRSVRKLNVNVADFKTSSKSLLRMIASLDTCQVDISRQHMQAGLCTTQGESTEVTSDVH